MQLDKKLTEKEFKQKYGMNKEDWFEIIGRYKWHLEHEGFLVLDPADMPEEHVEFIARYQEFNSDDSFYDFIRTVHYASTNITISPISLFYHWLTQPDTNHESITMITWLNLKQVEKIRKDSY